MSWIIRGVAPASWAVFDEDGDVVARGLAITRRRARQHIREYMELAT